MKLIRERRNIRNGRMNSREYRLGWEIENLEPRTLLSYADGNGAVVLSVTERNSGSALVITFDGPLDANPSNPAQSPTNLANYSVQLPAGNPEVVTSSLSSVPISSASYDSITDQVTLDLGTSLASGEWYRLFVNGIASASGSSTPGLLDANQNPIDGDYDDTASGDFYALFAWTTAGTPLDYTDSQGDAVTISLTGPGQLSAWRELSGDFNAGDLTAQANLASGLYVQQLTVTNGTASTVLSGSAVLAASGDGVVVIPPTIPGTFTNSLASYFQATAPAPPEPNPGVATTSNLPYTLQIEPVNLPNLPALESAVEAQDNVSGSPYQGDWLAFGGRTNGLHTFNSSGNFPGESENETIYVFNPTTGQVYSEPWSATDVPAGWQPALYAANEEFYQNGDTLYVAGGYGAADLGGGNFAPYTTYGTLTALSVNGLISAVVTKGSVTALAGLEQIDGQEFKVTGGEMSVLGGLTYLVVGQDFEGEYNPASSTGFTQTYLDEIQAFNINYNGKVAGSLSISNYQAQNDQVNFRRRDYNLGTVVLPNGQPALEIYGGVFTPGPGSLTTAGVGYRSPILIRAIGDTEVLPYQQAFSQYTAPHISLYSPSNGSMDTIFLGGISLYSLSFASGQLSLPLFNFPPIVAGLPFVNTITTEVQQANGAIRELEMPNQFTDLAGSEAHFFSASGLPQSASGVFNLDQLLGQPTTLGYMYGGIVSTVGLTTNQTTQTIATNAVYKIILVPTGGRATYGSLVDSLYQVLLNRVPTPAEQNYWVTWLNAGVSPARVAFAIIKSPEHRTLELNYYYNIYMNAQVDSTSQQLYLSEFAHGATEQSVIAQILNSAQFIQAASATGPTGNAAIVDALYMTLLNRAPTDSEGTAGTDLLNAGTPVSSLIDSVMTSNEYLTAEVDMDYTTYTGHLPTASQRNRGVNLLRRQTSERFVANLMGRRGYFFNHPGSTGRKRGRATS